MIKRMAFHCLSFAVGMLSSFSGFTKTFSPFGVSAVAASGKKYLLSSSAGAILGYVLFTDSITALRYIASVLALCVILGALKPFRGLYENPAVPVPVSFVCLFVTGLAVAFSERADITSLVFCFCESAVGALMSYVFTKTRETLIIKGSIRSLTYKEIISLVVSAMIMLLSVKEVSVGGVFPVRIISGFLILVCSFYGGTSGGSILGICCGISICLGGKSLFLLGCYAFSGMIAGLAARFGRIACSLGFAAAVLTVSVTVNGDLKNYTLFIEILLSCVLFLLLPGKARSFFESILRPCETSPMIENIRGDAVRRLSTASKFCAEISSSLANVNNALMKNERNDSSDICRKVRERVCGSCGLYENCWNESREETENQFEKLLELKKSGVYLEYKTVPARFSGKCIRTEQISSNYNRLFDEYRLRERCRFGSDALKEMAVGQFVNMSDLFDSISEKISDDVIFDGDTAARMKTAALSVGFEPIECCCKISGTEKMSLDMSLRCRNENADCSSLLHQLELITGRRFDVPSTVRNGKTLSIEFRESPDIRVVFSGAQSVSRGESFSGDAYSCFEDGESVFYAVICDGMGVGTNAAVSANLAVSLFEKLIKCGFSTDAVINTVNTALISKSGDECSVTLDVCEIDTFSGAVSFYKCGAPQTLARRNGKIYSVGRESLPLGIIGGTGYSSLSGELGKGDAVVMMSDGVSEKAVKYAESKLRSFSCGSVREFNSALLENIRLICGEENDDITVLTLALTADSGNGGID